MGKDKQPYFVVREKDTQDFIFIENEQFVLKPRLKGAVLLWKEQAKAIVKEAKKEGRELEYVNARYFTRTQLSK